MARRYAGLWRLLNGSVDFVRMLIFMVNVVGDIEKVADYDRDGVEDDRMGRRRFKLFVVLVLIDFGGNWDR